jgi:7,8-dihydroneopterin aldolase/epimerase/oxygenase
MDIRINVNGIKTWARHGVYENERISGRYFITDVSILADLERTDLLKDDLQATFNYEMANDAVRKKMQTPVQLLEKLAIEIAEELKSADTRIKEVHVKVTKLNPPLPGEVESTSVEVTI